MAESTEIPVISLDELDAVLDRARAEHWTKLSLIAPVATVFLRPQKMHSNVFRLMEPMGASVTRLTSLEHLQELELVANDVGDEGTAALASLTELTSLNLWSNNIGADGAAALASVTGLTSLNLNNNNIGNEGAAVLGALTSLTSLRLNGNIIGAEGAAALAALTGLKSLDLNYNSILAEGAAALASLMGLTSLNLWDNNIGADGAAALASLAELTSLNLNHNNIGDEGATALASLTGLTSLDLWDNNISAEGAAALASLTGLTSLDLSNNNVGDEGATALAAVTGLRSLGLSNSNIGDEGVTALASLSSLIALDLGNNNIGAKGAAALAPLIRLRSLILWNNIIGAEGAAALASLTGLTLLNLAGNEILELPRALLDLSLSVEAKEKWALDCLNLVDNPIEKPPLEIVQQGNAAIAAWFKAFDQEERPLNEVKVILVGDGGAGKTTLRKRLMDERPDKNEPQTHGIQIHDWPVNAGKKTEQLVHFWDFGGQEIMHATHQFFLSRRSLYLLVLDGRKEEDAEYWLKLIESSGGNSPVLVVLNKIDENPGFDANRPQLTEKYPGIQDFFRVAALKTRGGGIAELKKALKKHLRQVELASTKWPRTWFNVKKRLDENSDDYVEYSEFVDICEQEQVSGDEAQRTLIRYLNDLGIALYFEESRLRTTQVLDPGWVTQAVYRIINAPELADGHGLLALGQLETILKQSAKEHYCYPADKYGYIIDLMKKFQLCYELDTEHILVPDLLAVEQPDFPVPDGAVLRFRYEYDFLPRSVMPRFIVNEHADIHDELRWRTGVILRNPESGALAVVKSDARDRTISIEVTGERRREYFASLRRTFRKIHDSFQKLGVDEVLPLPDHPDRTVGYADLLGHEKMKKEWYVVGELQQEFSVKSLLDGIESPAERLQRQQAELSNRMQQLELKVARREVNRPMPTHATVINQNFQGDQIVGDKHDMSETYETTIGDGNQDLQLTVGKNIKAVTAKKITDSFNRVQAADASDEIKDLLKQLTQEVAKVADELPDEKADDAADALETLTKEVARESPRKEWWNLSAKGITDAAKATGTIGTTAISLVKELGPMLGF